MKKTLQILLVEDDEDDYVITSDVLSEAFGLAYKLEWRSTWEEGLEEIKTGRYDVCIVDFLLGERTGLDFVREATEMDCMTPMILLTGQDSRETDISVMEAGASDYLVKSQITVPLIERSIRYAVERKKVEKRLSSLARYDALTGLANRSQFHSKLTESIRKSRQTKQPVGLLLLDLDNFKGVNDSLGHPIGDQLLRDVAKRLNSSTKEKDVVSRLGGDEFTIILNELSDKTDAIKTAERIINVIAQPFFLSGNEVNTGTSIGITTFPDDGDTPSVLLKNADIALYKAKAEGKGHCQFFDMRMNAEILARKALEMDLSNAFEQEEFVLHYQPVVEAEKGTLAGVDAKLLWKHPEKGLQETEQFMPTVRKMGLVVLLGEWFVNRACRQLMRWQEKGLKTTAFLNLPVALFEKTDMASYISAAAERASIEPVRMKIQITEDKATTDREKIKKQLERLAVEGFGLVMDGYGTGTSSIAAIKNSPFDTIKIAPCFVTQPETAKAIVMLGKSLDVVVIADGIETEEQLDMMKNVGCDGFQGKFFTKPLPAKEFVKWLQNVPLEEGKKD